VFGTIVAEVIQSVSALGTPPADVDSVPCGEQPSVPDIVLVSPPRGAVEVLRILRELARATAGENEEDADTE
jgi:hypothetical protein